MAVLIGATNGGYMVLVPPQSGATATVSALVNKDGSGNVAVPTEQYIQNASGLYVPVSSTNPLPTVLTGSLVPKPYLQYGLSPAVSVPAGGTYLTGAMTLGGYAGIWLVEAVWGAATTGAVYIHWPIAAGYQGISLLTEGTAAVTWFGAAGASPLAPVIYGYSDGFQISNTGASAETLTKFSAYVQ